MRFGVAMIVNVFYPSIGGAQTHTLRLSQKLRARDVDAYVITRYHKGLQRYEVIDGVPTFRVGSGIANKPVAALTFTLDALRVIFAQRQRTQILHAHQLVSPTTIGLAARVISGKPLVLNPHRSGPLGDVSILTRKRPYSGPFRVAAVRKLADAHVCISTAVEQELAGIGVPPERLWAIANGVDVDHFAPVDPARKAALRQQLGLPADVPLVLYAGRLVKEKGLDVLLQAWHLLSPQLPSAQLVIIGEGDQAAALRQLTAELDLTSRVNFLPGCADVAPFLQAADAYVLPSFAEGLPVALLEGMASALPCVATATSGSAQLISDQVNGRLTPIGEAAPLADALIAALRDPAATTWAHNARQTIMDRFALDRVADRYIEMYTTLLPNLARATVPSNGMD
jgi:glycosyltransferase involved in cell wall biosynthesis